MKLHGREEPSIGDNFGFPQGIWQLRQWFFNRTDDLNTKRSKVMHKHHPKTETPAQPASTKSPSESEQALKGTAKSQEVVRVHAYQKWEAAGKPNGDGVNFWLEAEQEVLQAK
jgi:hypothetical protein